MAKLIIMQGLPASGKSTKAEELMRAMGNAVRINKDLLRTMLHFDKFNGINEGMTKDTAKLIAKYFLGIGENVIIDDTNLNPGTLQGWKDLGKECEAKVEVVPVLTSVEECLKRDALREKKVGSSVIFGMALQNGLIKKPEKGFVICDIDGTVADCSHRLRFLEGETKDWKGFFSEMAKDTPRKEVIEQLKSLNREGFPVIFVSARPDTYREVTENWLRDNVGINYVGLLMRRSNDKRPDTEVKQQIFDIFFKEKYPIHLVIDDRPTIIRMWEANGLKVLDVGAGIEF